MYSKRIIRITALLLSIIIFSITNFFVFKISNNSNATVISITEDNVQNKDEESAKVDITYENLNQENNIENSETNKTDENIWKIEIPKISLDATIAEGTESSVLNSSVGHFKETQLLTGNVGLAAHNRGYTVNRFGRIKELVEGDEIIYTFGKNKRTYKVVRNIQISDIDWSYLENTEENTITLITCIENKPAYRLCVQGIEKN